MLGYKDTGLESKAPTYINSGKEGERSIDWREQGCVQHIKDQGRCGSCYSFAATGQIESAHCAATGELLDLADKDCVDCSFREGNKGCNGGQMTACYKYFQNNHKICWEEDYPYAPKYEVCAEKKCTNEHIYQEPVTDYWTVPKNNPQELMDALDQHPVAVAIAANSGIFQTYKSGILQNGKEEDEQCGTGLNHGVLAVGYSFNGDLDSMDNYWIVKNSWGEKWGDEGYIKIGFGTQKEQKNGGVCGILKDPSHALN